MAEITVLAHGTFDLIHEGHVAHLENARALGDRLVVSVTRDEYVRKGPHRPIHSHESRMAMLRALRCVDEVILAPDRNAVGAIELVRPDVLCKGLDWQHQLDDPDLKADTAAMLAIGGTVRFIGPTLGSSSAIANRLVPHTPDLQQFLDIISPAAFREGLDALTRLKVVVLGDSIRDIYHTVRIQGLTAKASVPSYRWLRSETMDGGVDAIVRHCKAFTPHVTHIPLGETVSKERWVSEPSGDQPLTKYAAMMKQPIPSVRGDELGWVQSALHDADVILVGDFGHGAMTAPLRKLVQDDAKFLAVNCQTNSANYGFNILPQRYWRCDLFSLDRTELALAAGEKSPDWMPTLGILAKQLHAQYGFLTRGDVDTMAVRDTAYVTCPALNAAPVDTLGAGDAFFAVVALAGAAGLPLPLCTLLGQLAGYQAVQIVGNRSSVDRQRLREHGLQLLAR